MPIADRLLGEDFALVEDRETGLVDLVVDAKSGGTDAQRVRGIDNLKQAVITRLSTELGTDPLYRALGVQRTVGIGSYAVDSEIIRIRLRAAVAADPRVEQVSIASLSLTTAADTIQAEMDAVVRGLAAPITIATTAVR
jgi:hypothetical protein